ncbi:retrovirus-related Pol polyprotein from transposon 17.6 [Trichonephila clavipes]|nr:retrovirus-related Pol polyprotein from transposon 17.6 [Trichonephila clavipes]
MEDAVELIHSIGRANIITTLDLLKGYWAIPMAEDSKILHLSRLIGNSTVSREFSRAYIDDIAIFSKNWEEHLLHLDTILKKLSELNFPVNLKKCAFEKLKLNIWVILSVLALVEAPSLYSPVPDTPYTIHSDASQIGIAACLSQKCGDKCYPIAYASQKLSKTQQSWSTIEREAFAIVWSLKKFEIHFRVASQPLLLIGEQRCPRNTTWRSATCCPSRAVLPSLTPDMDLLDSPGEVESCDNPFTNTLIRNESVCHVSKLGEMEK